MTQYHKALFINLLILGVFFCGLFGLIMWVESMSPDNFTSDYAVYVIYTAFAISAILAVSITVHNIRYLRENIDYFKYYLKEELMCLSQHLRQYESILRALLCASLISAMFSFSLLAKSGVTPGFLLLALPAFPMTLLYAWISFNKDDWVFFGKYVACATALGAFIWVGYSLS